VRAAMVSVEVTFASRDAMAIELHWGVEPTAG
jgi:hypothetical protein